jgi:AcrR family transcriptional regulator
MRTWDITMTDDKVARTVKAACEIFLRYGYARTTMGDIARAAGMSRPALYLLFPGKEQVFEAATMFLAKQRLEDIRLALESCQGMEQKLTTACQMLLVSIYELQQTTPDARDMDDLDFQVVREIYTMFEVFFSDVISEDGISYPEPVDEIANVMLYCARGLRNVAPSA